jgi:heme exporter protein A
MRLSCQNISSVSHTFRGVGVCLSAGSLLRVRSEGNAASLFLEMLAGLHPLHNAQATLDGIDTISALHAGRMLYLGTKNPVNPWISVEKNVNRLATTPMLAGAAMQYFGLTAFARRSGFRLSADQRRRVTITRLLTSPCNAWIIDETNSSLSDEGQGLLYALIANRCNQGGIVVLATDKHSIIEPMQSLDLRDFSRA